MRPPPASYGPVFAPPARRVVDSVTVLLPVPPSVNRIYRHTRERGPVKSDAYKQWIGDAGWRLQAQRPGRVPGPYVLLLAVPRTSRMDIDNAAKAVSDLLQRHGVVENDREAVREPVTGGAHVRAAARGTDTGVGWGRLDRLDPDQPDRGRDRVKRPGPNSRQNVDRVPVSRKPGVTPKSAPEDSNIRAKGSFHASTTQLVTSRNARNVWTIAPKAYREAHFATFPPALAERCIKAGVPAQACGLCGAALPHPRCEGLCRFAEPVAGRVLDPFGGAGTVGLVATGLGLDATLIELNPEYAAMSARRIGAAAVIVGAPAPLPMAAE